MLYNKQGKIGWVNWSLYSVQLRGQASGYGNCTVLLNITTRPCHNIHCLIADKLCYITNKVRLYLVFSSYMYHLIGKSTHFWFSWPLIYLTHCTFIERPWQNPKIYLILRKDIHVGKHHLMPTIHKFAK